MSYHIGDSVLFNADGMWDPNKPSFLCQIIQVGENDGGYGSDVFRLNPLDPLQEPLRLIVGMSACDDDTFWCWQGYFVRSDFQPIIEVDITTLL